MIFVRCLFFLKLETGHTNGDLLTWRISLNHERKKEKMFIDNDLSLYSSLF